jgi:uncharacterized membrane protein (UPF0127 family)
MDFKLAPLLMVILLTGCSSSNSSPLGLPMTDMQIGSKNYHLEIAGNDTSREHGLMERDDLPVDHGMIFVFPQASVQNFWMHHTRFPLDIIYADNQAKVLSVDSMKPFDEITPHRSAGPAKYAIELNVGQVDSCGIKVGDQLQIPPAVINAKVE